MQDRYTASPTYVVDNGRADACTHSKVLICARLHLPLDPTPVAEEPDVTSLIREPDTAAMNGGTQEGKMTTGQVGT